MEEDQNTGQHDHRMVMLYSLNSECSDSLEPARDLTEISHTYETYLQQKSVSTFYPRQGIEQQQFFEDHLSRHSSSSRQQELENSGFITTYFSDRSPQASKSREKLNQRVLSNHRFCVSPPTIAKRQPQQPAQQRQFLFAKNNAINLQGRVSPISKQRMSPRTLQPSDVATTLPPFIDEPQSALFESQSEDEESESLKTDSGDNLSSGVQTRNYCDTVDLPLSFQQPQKIDDCMIEPSIHDLRSHESNNSQGGYVLDNQQFLSFGVGRTLQRGANAQKIDEMESVNTSKILTKNQEAVSKSIKKKEKSPDRARVENRQAVSGVSSAMSRSRVHDHSEFILRQQEIESRRQEKLQVAQYVKRKKEQEELNQHATFKPTLLARYKSKSPRNGLESWETGRTVKQFINDQQNHMFKTQAKINSARAQQKVEEKKRNTGRPQLSIKSNKICKKIQQEFMNQFLEDEPLDEGPSLTALQMEAKSAMILIDPAPVTKRKKSPALLIGPPKMQKSASSPMAQKLAAQKRALAKAVPEKPTFRPNINPKSKVLAKKLQQKQQEDSSVSDMDQSLCTQGDLSNMREFMGTPHAAPTKSPIQLDERSQAVNVNVSRELVYDHDLSQNQDHFEMMEGYNQLSTIQEDASSLEWKQKMQKTSKILRLSSDAKQEPRIGMTKAQEKELKQAREKKQQESLRKKRNDSLILRNFKKEFNKVLSEFGLDKVETKEKAKSLQSEEGPIEVDFAQILLRLGFISSLTPSQRDPQRSIEGQFVVVLEEVEQKLIFKQNLFTVLSAIQSINLRDHYNLFGQFGLLQSHVLEEITQTIDQSVCNSNTSFYSRARSKHDNNNVSRDAPCPISQQCEVLLQLAFQPFPFSLNNSHLVKLHLFFMSFFLIRKDTISRGHRISLERNEMQKYKYNPDISLTQTSRSPIRERIPISAPNKYYNQIKRNIKDRAAELCSMRAEKERIKMDACTFRPQVNAMSTKIAYKQVAEMHIGQKEFDSTYMQKLEEPNEVVQERSNKARESMDSQQSQAIVSPRMFQATMKSDQKLSKSNEKIFSRSPAETRITNRINKLVKGYVTDRQSKKQLRDGGGLKCQEQEQQRSQLELKAKPRSVRSQMSFQTAVQTTQISLQVQTPKPKQNQTKQQPRIKQSDSYSGKLQYQLMRRKKSKKASNKAKNKTVPTIQIEQTFMGNKTAQQMVPNEKSPQNFPMTADNRKEKCHEAQTLLSSTGRQCIENDQLSHVEHLAMPEVSNYTSQVFREEREKMMFMVDLSPSAMEDDEEDFASDMITPSLLAPPSVADIQCFSNNSIRMQAFSNSTNKNSEYSENAYQFDLISGPTTIFENENFASKPNTVAEEKAALTLIEEETSLVLGDSKNQDSSVLYGQQQVLRDQAYSFNKIISASTGIKNPVLERVSEMATPFENSNLYHDRSSDFQQYMIKTSFVSQLSIPSLQNDARQNLVDQIEGTIVYGRAAQDAAQVDDSPCRGQPYTYVNEGSFAPFTAALMKGSINQLAQQQDDDDLAEEDGARQVKIFADFDSPSYGTNEDSQNEAIIQVPDELPYSEQRGLLKPDFNLGNRMGCSIVTNEEYTQQNQIYHATPKVLTSKFEQAAILKQDGFSMTDSVDLRAGIDNQTREDRFYQSEKSAERESSGSRGYMQATSEDDENN